MVVKVSSRREETGALWVEGGHNMSIDTRMIHLYSYYRDAELRGATLLLKLTLRVEDTESQVKLSRHLADETRHAWLWTKRITDLGYEPVPIDDGYQTRIGKAVGIPRSLIDLFALTVVVEERAQRRYIEHAQRSDADPETLEILHEVTKDEKWHIGWIKDELKEMREQTVVKKKCGKPSNAIGILIGRSLLTWWPRNGKRLAFRFLMHPQRNRHSWHIS